MSSLAASYTELLIIKVYISKLTDIFLSTVEDNTEYSSENITLKNGNISLQNVSYRFDKFSENVLNNINLNICDGEKVAIIGPSGSGKSTLIRLIAGLLDIENGEIKVSGNNLKFFKKKVYRKQLGIVTQDSQVFSGTFRENILMGRHFSDEHIIDCAKKVNLIDLINDLPLGLDTLISEDGNNLSGGQKQRIAICRAIINNPKILVFDEPTSSLDNISERIIMHNIFKERTTVIVVAHRLGMIDAFDKVILMNKGIVEAVGTNKELLSENLLYRKLVNKNEK
ncbi:ATP-binding cassette domain-containing protein [Enterococcus faecalis]|uniref:ATP-binding cassette domain-containing protein n=1 Tax=Enterococcus faecalis TaxID=1351 RepID=UPI0025B0A7B5|nr:ATP-binding cassette domain-containing protein [Enterococcus faecalis]MDN3077234.1 ATP-binding cassette domain-containing protein [Enterococcus faecalis]